MKSRTRGSNVKLVGWGVVLGCVLALGGCSSYEEVYHGRAETQSGNISKAKTDLTGSKDFNGNLAQDYYALSSRGTRDSDWVDSDWFARKSIAASRNKDVTPENNMNWLIPGNAAPSVGIAAEMTDARHRLVTALDNGGRTKFPAVSARAQANYDCWIERSEHYGVRGFNDPCRQDFERYLADLNLLMNPQHAELGDAYFAHDSAVLTPQAQQEIKQAAAKIAPTSAGVKITGKADRTGSDPYNMGLSQRRADAVRQAFIADGISENRIDTHWTGERDPLPVPTPNGVSEPKNRVVEINTLMPPSQVAAMPE